MHRQQRMVHAGGEREIARGEPMPFGEQRFAGAEIEPLRAHVAAFGRGLLHLDPGAVAFGHFLDHHRIGAGRHKTAGENARRLARTDRGIERPAGGDLADDFQAGRRSCDIGGAHGIAVHGRDIGGRLGAARFEIVGENAATGLVDRHFVRRQRRGVRQHLIERLGNGNQRHLIYSRARKWPLRPPLFSTSRMPSMRMPRSTAFTMS